MDYETLDSDPVSYTHLNGGKHTHHLERIFQLLGVLLQLFIQTVEAVHIPVSYTHLVILL